MTDIRPDAWFGWTRIEREEWSGQALVKLTQEGGHVWLTERTFKELSEALTPWPSLQRTAGIKKAPPAEAEGAPSSGEGTGRKRS